MKVEEAKSFDESDVANGLEECWVGIAFMLGP